jgi:hypothetical protein
VWEPISSVTSFFDILGHADLTDFLYCLSLLGSAFCCVLVI